MPRVCTICHHPERIAIEGSTMAGTSIRSTAKSFGVSSFALQRHLQHVAAVVAKRAQSEEIQTEAAGSLRGRIEQIIVDSRRIMKAAEKKNQFSAALQGVRTQLSCLEVIGKLTGELQQGAGEIVPGVAGSASAAAASVTVNLPAPPARNPADLVKLLKEIYNLGTTDHPQQKPEPIV
jgi:hypothetical protein